MNKLIWFKGRSSKRDSQRKGRSSIVQAGGQRRRDWDGEESKFSFSVVVKLWFSLAFLEVVLPGQT